MSSLSCKFRTNIMWIVKISPILLFAWICSPGLATPLANQSTTTRTSLSEMQGALVILTNLTAAQKAVWEQQDAYEKEVRDRNRDEEERHVSRTRALEKEQHQLKEIWALLARKLKSISRGSDNHGKDINHIKPKDCADVYLEGELTSGVYKIWPTWFKNTTGFSVYCDMETDGGGWTVIHRWGNLGFPKDYFKRTFAEYKDGFGNLESVFWLGNDMITALTGQGSYQLIFEIHRNPEKVFSLYNSFWTEHWTKSYKLHVERYDASSTGGDIFSAHNGANFQVYEVNTGQCNVELRPAWWFTTHCPLNQSLHLNVASNSDLKEVLKSEMKIRPVDFHKMKETP